MGAREVLLLAAEDAFEFERWREAGPVTSEIDPEASAAEIVEYEALGIPLPRELDVLRRELEFAPAVREAIRSSANVLRRNGRAEASALVGLGPQALMPWGGRGIDPRLLMLMDPRLVEPRAKPARAARAPVVVDEPPDESFERAPTVGRGPVEPELVDEPRDDDDDDDELDDDFDMPPPPARSRRPSPSAARARKPERARARAQESDEHDDDSLISIQPAPNRDRTNTIILAAVSSVAVIALLWIAFGDKDEPATQDAAAQQQVQQPPPPQPQPQPPPMPAPVEPVVDPMLGAAPTPAPASPGSRGSGISGSRGSSPSSSLSSSSAAASKPAGGGVNPFSTYDANVMGGGQPQPKPAAGGTTPAAGGTTPAPAPAPAPTDGGAAPAPAPAPVDGGAAPAPAPAPAPEPLPEPELTKSKMTPAIRDAITKKVGDLQRCYNDALIGKPDLEGRVVFTISLDQDGVVKKVDVGKDAVGYGVAECASKKIRGWTLPSAGIPIIFDLPFDFQQPKG
jgi:hypothetical protein